MSIAVVDTKILWGRAGGRCSKPGCGLDLTAVLEAGNYIVGEMAHVIGNKPTAARGVPEGGSDRYENLILLCPTHHTHIDKAPQGTYPVEVLHQWKSQHEAKIRSVGSDEVYETFDRLRFAVGRILVANKNVFDFFGPHSAIAQDNPESNAYLIWELRRVDRILPNNQKILNIIDANSNLLESAIEISAVEKFRIHAESYERHVYYRIDSYPLFPQDFAEIFSI
ncbi:HNH endonuclease signature motif containing protein [Alcaligenaceae bacterium C4P045]|nr:HNH endonuclease signature motif containing protein [Alcaligenaceae bacterium C4P045]